MQIAQALHFYWQASIVPQVGVPPILIGDPLTIEFNYYKNITGQLNQASLKIYNLNQDTKHQIEFDRFLTQNANSVSGSINAPNQLYLPCTLSVGFGTSSLGVVFSGNMQKAYSTKQHVDTITQIDLVDGMYSVNNSFTNYTIDSPVTTREVITLLTGSMKNVQQGYISGLPNVQLPFFSFNGRIFDKLRKLSNGNGNSDSTCADCFIDNGKLNILATNEAFTDNGIQEFTDNSILGAPRATGQYIEFDIVFNPQLRLGQIIQLNTRMNAFVSGQYKIVGLTGQCTLGNSKIGSNITTVQVFRPINAELIPVFSGL